MSHFTVSNGVLGISLEDVSAFPYVFVSLPPVPSEWESAKPDNRLFSLLQPARGWEYTLSSSLGCLAGGIQQHNSSTFTACI